MTTLREAAQMALDALDSDNPDIQLRAATHLRAALAQPEQEPVAWFMEGTFEDGTPSFTQVCETDPEFYVPLYTAPPQREWQYRRGDRLLCLETEEYCVIHVAGTNRQWIKFPDSHVGVYTNEQVAEMFELLPKEREWQGLTDQDYEAMAEKYVTNCYFDTLKYARAIEAKLKEKNNG